MSLAVRLFPEPVRSLAFGSIIAGYTAIGTPFINPSRVFFLQNLTDATLMFSFDGVNDNFPLPASGYILIDVTTNKTVSVGCFFAQGTVIYVKRIGIPTSGSVYLSTFYGAGVVK